MVISALGDVKEVDLSLSGWDYLLLASDGVWDAEAPEQVSQILFNGSVDCADEEVGTIVAVKGAATSKVTPLPAVTQPS